MDCADMVSSIGHPDSQGAGVLDNNIKMFSRTFVASCLPLHFNVVLLWSMEL